MNYHQAVDALAYRTLKVKRSIVIVCPSCCAWSRLTALTLKESVYYIFVDICNNIFHLIIAGLVQFFINQELHQCVLFVVGKVYITP